MSLSSLPTELKEQIVRAAHVNDLDLLAKGSAFPDTEYGPEGEFPTEFRYPRRSTGRRTQECTGDPSELRWDAWLGQSALALSSVNREFREVTLPLILEPLSTLHGRTDVDERFASALARYSRSLVFATLYERPRPRPRLPNGQLWPPPTPAQRRDALLAERSVFLKFVDGAAESMPLLKNITVHSSIPPALFQPAEDITEDTFSSGGNNAADENRQRADVATPSVSPKTFLLSGGFPALTRLADRVDSWTFSTMPSSVIIAFLSLAPTKVRALSLRDHPRRYRHRPARVASRSEIEEGLDEILEAVKDCVHLERLSINAPSTGSPASVSWPPVLASLSATLSDLHLRLGQPAPVVTGLLRYLPSLRTLHLDATGDVVDEHFAALASHSTGPLVALPFLASLQITDVEPFTAYDILRLISTPSLQLLTLSVRPSFDNPPQMDEHTPLALAQLVAAALPVLRVVRCKRLSDFRSRNPMDQPYTLSGKQLFLALNSLKAELALSSPFVHVELDNPDPDSYTAAAALPPGKSALELARWAVRELEKAERAGDEGQARLVRGSLEGVARLQNLLKP